MPFRWCFLQVWIEFGRIKLPQGYHPNDVEEEWGKLIIEMLEREKLLRPAVERSVLALRGHPAWRHTTLAPKPFSFSSLCRHRLELLLQIANKIQNGALSCEEKLTLAKNTLQAVSGGWYFPPGGFSPASSVMPVSVPLFCVGWGFLRQLSLPVMSSPSQQDCRRGGYLVVSPRALGTGCCWQCSERGWTSAKLLAWKRTTVLEKLVV